MYGEAQPKRGTFFRLKLTQWVGNSGVEVYRIENLSFNYLKALLWLFIIWLQYYARSDWLFSCNKRALLATCPRHIRSVFNLIYGGHPY